MLEVVKYLREHLLHAHPGETIIQKKAHRAEKNDLKNSSVIRSGRWINPPENVW